MGVRRASIRDVLIGPDVVVVFLVLGIFSLARFLIPFAPIQIPGYILAVGLGGGAVTVVTWYLIAVISGAVSRTLRARFGKPDWDFLGVTFIPITTGVAAAGFVTIGRGLLPLVQPIETTVTTCTSENGCTTRTELMTDPNLPIIIGGFGLLVIGVILLFTQSPRWATSHDRTHS